MLPRGERNTGIHLLDIPVRASLLAEAHLPLDRGTLEAWTDSRLSSKQCKPGQNKVVQEQLTRHHPERWPHMLSCRTAYAVVWNRIWHILSSVCITSLWIQRNRVTFEQADVSIAGSVHEFWETGMRQLRADVPTQKYKEPV